MGYLALNQRSLSRLSHHWLWGLQVDNASNTNFYSAAVYLQTNPVAREKIEVQIRQINHYAWLIQALYWFFNLNQYRLHYYQLQANLSWELHQEGAQMLNQVDKLGVTLTESFLLGTATAAGFIWLNRRLLEPHIKQSMTWFSQRTKSIFPSVNEIESNALPGMNNTVTALTALFDHNTRPSDTVEPYYAADDETMTLIISSDMLAPLKILDITTQTGDCLSFKELRTAYHKRCLRTHPDKTRVASNSEFRATTEAYETLLSHMEKMVSAPSLLSEAELSLLAKIVALRKEMQEEHKIWQQMNAQAKRQTEALRRHDEHLERQGEHLGRQGEHLERLGTHFKQQGEHLERLGTHFKQQGEHLDLQEEQLNELTGRANAERIEMGVQPLTPFAPLAQEDIDGFQADPDYFVKKRLARSDAAPNLTNTNTFFSTPPNEARSPTQLIPPIFSAEAS